MYTEAGETEWFHQHNRGRPARKTLSKFLVQLRQQKKGGLIFPPFSLTALKEPQYVRCVSL